MFVSLWASHPWNGDPYKRFDWMATTSGCDYHVATSHVVEIFLRQAPVTIAQLLLLFLLVYVRRQTKLLHTRLQIRVFRITTSIVVASHAPRYFYFINRPVILCIKERATKIFTNSVSFYNFLSFTKKTSLTREERRSEENIPIIPWLTPLAINHALFRRIARSQLPVGLGQRSGGTVPVNLIYLGFNPVFQFFSKVDFWWPFIKKVTFLYLW